jgi:hypothetical protein
MLSESELIDAQAQATATSPNPFIDLEGLRHYRAQRVSRGRQTLNCCLTAWALVLMLLILFWISLGPSSYEIRIRQWDKADTQRATASTSDGLMTAQATEIPSDLQAHYDAFLPWFSLLFLLALLWVIIELGAYLVRNGPYAHDAYTITDTAYSFQ